jgi:thymidylate synthase
MNALDKQYQTLLQTILDFGVEKKDRTGTGTKSIFGYTIRHNMKDGFPLLTTKKMAWKTMVTELLWFLRGDTNIKYLVDNNCHIWDGDAWKNFCNGHTDIFVTKEEFIERIKDDPEFAKKWGSLGPVYGKQWRSWDVPKILTIEKGKIENSIGTEWGSWERNPIDQIANLISELKTNPDSRRLMVNAYNVGELDTMVLPPCHYGFQVYTRELSLEERFEIVSKREGMVLEETKYIWGWDTDKETHDDMILNNIPTRAISLMYNCRSQDVPLGTPFNISSYALLLEIIAKMVNMVSDELIANMGDCHIYLNQIDGVKEQLIREPYSLPKLVISNQVNFNEGIDEFLNSCLISDFQIEGYQSHSTIKMPLSN